MKYLIDNSEPKEMDDLFEGQLLTPLTAYRNWSPQRFAIENGCFKRFRYREFKRLIEREKQNKDGCIYVTCPDVVGCAVRTLALFELRHKWIPKGWPIALVAQNGLEDMEIPWSEFQCLFIGGDDEFKRSPFIMETAIEAKNKGKHVHLGRCQSDRRHANWNGIADTADGSGISRGLGRHLKRIKGGLKEKYLFDGVTGEFES